MNKNKIAVIGSGLTALCVVKQLLANGQTVDLIAPETDPKLKSGEANFHSGKKQFFGASSVYDIDSSYFDVTDKSLDIPISGTNRGFSSVWGAGIKFASSNDLPGASEAEIKIANDQVKNILRVDKLAINEFGFALDPKLYRSESMQKVIKKSTVLNTKIRIRPSSLAVDSSKCIQCGECLTGCPTGAIFGSEDFWNQDNEPNLVRINDYVDSIKEIPDGFELSLKNSGTKSAYSKIFIAAGAISTSALLQRSNLIPLEAQLEDNQIFFVPIFSLRLKAYFESKFTLSQAFVYGSERSHKNSWMSIIEATEELKKRSAKFLRGLEKIVPNFVWGRLLAGVSYLPADQSGKIVLETKNGITNISFQSPKTSLKLSSIRAVLKVSNSLLSSGLVPIPVAIQLGNIGGSYHVGKLTSNGDSLIDENGTLGGKQGIYICDAAALKEVRPGPITAIVMAQASIIVARSIQG